MGKKPSSGPEMINGNVPRSGVGKQKKAARTQDESLWSDLHEEHLQQEQLQLQEAQMREAVQAKARDFLTVHVVGTEGERSASVSSADGSVAKSSSMV